MKGTLLGKNKVSYRRPRALEACSARVGEGVGALRLAFEEIYRCG